MEWLALETLNWKEQAATFLCCVDRAMEGTKTISSHGRESRTRDWETRIAAAAIVLQHCPPDEATRGKLLLKALKTYSEARKELETCPHGG